MYLYKKTYVGANYEHNQVVAEINITKGGKKLNINPKRVTYIQEDIGYWRKANHIHQWFVDNCQDGEDDCRDAYVSREKLKELLATCKEVKEKAILVAGEINNGYSFKDGQKIQHTSKGKVVSNPEICEDLLPTQSGFFFGNTDYDEYYMKDIDDTIEIVEAALKELEQDTDASIYYTSSW